MAIITKPTISKGQANEIDLSKSDLAAVSKVVNDSYFSDQTNWSKVAMEYESDTGEQIEMLIFDASQESPKANFEVSEKAKDNWQVKSVIIMDFDGGYLKLVRGDLTVADFDIVLGSVGGDVGAIFQSSLTASSITLSSGDTIATADNSGVTDAERHTYQSVIDISSGGKYYNEFRCNDTSGAAETAIVGFALVSNESNLAIGPVSYPFAADLGTIQAYYCRTGYTTTHFHYGTGGTRTNADLGVAPDQGDIIGIALDFDNDKFYISINDVYVQGHDPSTNTGGFPMTNRDTQLNLLYFGVMFYGGNTGEVEITNLYSSPTGFTYIGSDT